MSTQGPVKLTTESPLASNDPAANVAVNQQIAAREGPSGIANRDIYPARIFAKDLSLETNLTIGNGVYLGDGMIHSNHLATDEAVITTSVQVGAALITSSKISVANLSSMSADLGSINTGSIAIGTGGVSIGNVTAGVSISSNVIRCITSGVARVTIDGTTGVITASKFALTSDGTASISMTTGGYTFKSAASGARISIDSTGIYAYNSSGVATTSITSAGVVTIQSATSGARNVITASSIDSYNSAGTNIVKIAGSTGIDIVNSSATPGVTERLSLYYNTTEKGWVAGWSTGAVMSAVGYLQLGGLTETTIVNLVTTAGTGLQVTPTTVIIATDLTVGTHIHVRSGYGTIYSGDSAPTGGVAGDIYLRTGATAPGLYVNEGTWKHCTTH